MSQASVNAVTFVYALAVGYFVRCLKAVRGPRQASKTAPEKVRDRKGKSESHNKDKRFRAVKGQKTWDNDPTVLDLVQDAFLFFYGMPKTGDSERDTRKACREVHSLYHKRNKRIKRAESKAAKKESYTLQFQIDIEDAVSMVDKKGRKLAKQLRTVARMLASGSTASDIAVYMGVSKAYISQLIKRIKEDKGMEEYITPDTSIAGFPDFPMRPINLETAKPIQPVRHGPDETAWQTFAMPYGEIPESSKDASPERIRDVPDVSRRFDFPFYPSTIPIPDQPTNDTAKGVEQSREVIEREFLRYSLERDGSGI